MLRIAPRSKDSAFGIPRLKYADRMPTVLRVGRFRFFFYSNESAEPPHIHVEAGEKVAKYWLELVEVAANHGFRSHELTEIRALVVEYREQFLEAWNGYFGD